MSLLWHGKSHASSQTADHKLMLPLQSLSLQVQEQLDYEYFVKSYQTDERTWQNVTLKETVTPVNSHWKLGSLKMGDCKPYFCVSVPGQSEWLQADPVQSMIQAAAGSMSIRNV